MTTNKTSQRQTQPTQLTVSRVLAKSTFLIYHAHSNKDNQDYAMKVFPYQDNVIDPCFLRESRMAFISHPNIVSVKEVVPDVSTSKGRSSYILMELAKYGDLAELLSSEKIPDNEVLIRTFFRQMVNAVEYLHSQNIAHMDIKPDNFLVGSDFNLKLTDFDTAISTECKESLIRRGTNIYRSPEVRDNRLADPMAADIYALGVVLFVLRLRCFPYVEDDASSEFQELFIQGKEKFWTEHPNGKELRKTSDKDFKSLVMSMCREKASKRASLSDIKQSRWYKGPVYSEKELSTVMATLLQ